MSYYFQSVTCLLLRKILLTQHQTYTRSNNDHERCCTQTPISRSSIVSHSLNKKEIYNAAQHKTDRQVNIVKLLKHPKEH